ncbi:hypothetical protein SNOUR_38400 [Streptomyces noursei ATCC 11455]|nr:hypothetical protein SNOUR_38400 [Streptomyces noursei ATCC 11455]
MGRVPNKRGKKAIWQIRCDVPHSANGGNLG